MVFSRQIFHLLFTKSKFNFVRNFMKIILHFILLNSFLLCSAGAYAQIGIGTSQPDKSSALDISSNKKGFLMPRLSTEQRDEIEEPATGLMIYNSTSNDGQINIGTPEAPNWIGLKKRENSSIKSVDFGNDVRTESTVCVLIPGMTISPPPGTYLALFNGQISSNQTFSSSQGIIDVEAIKRTLIGYPGGSPHALVFGNDEVLLPGVYDVTGATSIAGTLTLDGNNEPNSVFIIRGTGAFTTGAGSKIILTNGANANNVFWVSGAAMSTGAGTIMNGNMFSTSEAIALGANTIMRGTMYSITGALTMGAGTQLTAPTGASVVDFGVLSTFAMFTESGAISGCPTCTINGDVGTGAGSSTGFDGINGTVFGPGTTSIPNTSTYTIWKNGIAVPNSARTIVVSATVSLQALVEVEENEVVEIRWRVTAGGATLHHRIFSLVPG